jgi:uncharacterized protein (DUF433 family)
MADLLGFTVEQTARVTGLSVRQLRYWDTTGFFSPGFMDKRLTPLKLYTFRDLVGLRALAELRRKVPLQELRKTATELAERHSTPWASLTLYVSGRRAFFEDTGAGALVAARPGRQIAFRIEMIRIARDTQTAVDKMRQRTANDIGKIQQKRNVVHNEPVISGTRIPTAAIWNLHESGRDFSAIVSEYPRLTEDDIEAAISFERARRSEKAG